MTQNQLPPNLFKSKDNADLALKVTCWLTTKGYVCAVSETDDGVITVTYVHEDHPAVVWPPVRIDAGKINFPKGSPADLVFAYMEGT